MRSPSSRPSWSARLGLALLGGAAVALGIQGCGPALTAAGAVLLTLDDDDDPVDTPPAVSVTTPAGTVNHIVAIGYRLSDPDPNDRASITVDYAVGSGAFQPATQAFADGAEGTQDLTTSPAGTDHVFFWNSAIDLGLVNAPAVRLRVTATDASAPPGAGASATTAPFAVLNRFITTLTRSAIPAGTAPSGISVAANGDLLLADSGGSRIVRIDRVTGAPRVVAGTGDSGYNGQNIAGPTAMLNRPTAVFEAPFPDLDLIVADSANGLVRRIDDASDFISDILGSGTFTHDDYSTDGLLSTVVSISPRDLALDALGDPFVLAADGGRVRVLNLTAADLLFPTQGAGGLPDPQPIGPGRLASVLSAFPASISAGPFLAFETPELDEGLAVAVWHDPLAGERLLYALQRGRGGAGLTNGPGLVVASYGAAATFDRDAAIGPQVTVTGGQAAILATDDQLPSLSVFADIALYRRQVLLLAAGDGALYAFNFSQAPVDVVGTTVPPGGRAVVAGTPGASAFGGDGRSPLEATLVGPLGAAVQGDAVFVSDFEGRVRVLAPPAMDVTVGALTVPGGTVGTVGVVLPGTQGAVVTPLNVVVAGNGDLLVADADPADPRSNRVLRVSAADGAVTTLAGTGVTGVLGDGGPAVDARVGAALSLAEDPARGLVLLPDFNHHRVRAVNVGGAPVTYLGVTIAPGELETVVGTGQPTSGDPGDGGPADQCTLLSPANAFADGAGLLWIADTGDHRIRVVNPTGAAVNVLGVQVAPGEIETVVGTGVAGDPDDDGDGGPAGAARLDTPAALLGPDGNLWLLDGLSIDGSPGSAQDGEARVRVVNLQPGPVTLGGVTIAPGEIETVIGAGVLRADDDSNLGDGGDALDATFRSPSGLSPRGDGLVFVSDAEDDRIRVANLAAGTVALLGVPLPPRRIETVVGDGVSGFTGDPSLVADLFSGAAGLVEQPRGALALPDGRLLFADAGNGAIRLANLADGPRSFAGIEAAPGEVVVVAGSRSGRVRPVRPLCAVADPDERLLFTDLGVVDVEPAVLQLDPRTRVVTRAVGTQQRTNASKTNLGDGGPALLATLAEPIGLDRAPSGSLLIADGGNQRIRWVNRTAGDETVGAVTIGPGAIDTVVEGEGDFNFANDDGQPLRDGAPGAGLDVVFPSAVAFHDASDVLWVGDEGSDRVLRLDAAAQVVDGVWSGTQLRPARAPTSAGPSPTGGTLILDAGADFYADPAVLVGDVVLVFDGVSPFPVVTTVAGVLPATDPTPGLVVVPQVTPVVQYVPVRAGRPTALAVVDADTAYVAIGLDALDGARIVRLDHQGGALFTATAIAGAGFGTWNGDALPALAMNLGEVRGLALDGQVLLAADRDTHRVVAINLGPGDATVADTLVPAGVARMVAGAGQGTRGFNGDAIPPAAALLNQPHGVAFTPLGGIVVVDTGAIRVRRFQR